ncbi:MAG TPA: hypothetical protein VMR77_00980 [Patescibacteria group bacterium]|jgi:hypothetical protein|nr:hypothetical protein [Patescibacteria group bacterium]
MKNKQILGALSLDLKRVALGYSRGSILMAERFFEEALKRKNELDQTRMKPYLLRFLNQMENLKKEQIEKAAEDALFYSTIFQNASQA